MARQSTSNHGDASEECDPNQVEYGSMDPDPIRRLQATKSLYWYSRLIDWLRYSLLSQRLLLYNQKWLQQTWADPDYKIICANLADKFLDTQPLCFWP